MDAPDSAETEPLEKIKDGDRKHTSMPDKLSSMAGTSRASCGRMCSGPPFSTILAMVIRLSACTSFTELPTPAMWHPYFGQGRD